MLEFSVFPTAYWAKNAPHRPAIMWERGNSVQFPLLSNEVSWAELHSLIVNLAAYYHFLPNQTIVYQGENRLANLLCYLAATAAGARMLSLNPALTAAQRDEINAHIKFDRLLNETDFVDFIPKQTAYSLPDFNCHSPATLTLTSGSSGNPKAVAHSIAQHLANASGVCELTHFSTHDSWLLSLPLFHVSGQGIVWRWLQQGAKLAVCEDKSQFYSILAQVSHASLVPTQLQRYLSQHRTRKTPQHFLLGGTYLPPELLKQAQLQQIIPYAGYGMTETASTICATANETDNVGQPLCGREVKLIQGEIYVRANCLALGYWQNGQLIPLQTENGWFATKDIGEWNKSGRLQVKGRRDNLFISGGENIQPEQIEQVLYRSGLIKQAFVLPIKDAEYGQRPIAVLEFNDEFNLQAVEKLQNFAKSKLEKFKLPTAYYRLESEKYHTGIKLSRKQLQDEFNLRFSCV